MSMDKNGLKSSGKTPATPVEDARAALADLLKAKRMEKAPSQEALARKLKKEIEDLRAVGVSFEAISDHLRASGIIISKKTLGAAVKKKTRRANQNKLVVPGPSTDTPQNQAASV